MFFLNLFKGLIDWTSEFGLFADMNEIINCSVDCLGCFFLTNILQEVVDEKGEVFVGENLDKIPNQAQKFKIDSSFQLHTLLFDNASDHFLNIILFGEIDGPFYFRVDVKQWEFRFAENTTILYQAFDENEDLSPNFLNLTHCQLLSGVYQEFKAVLKEDAQRIEREG